MNSYPIPVCRQAEMDVNDRLGFIPTIQMPDTGLNWRIFQRVEGSGTLPSHHNVNVRGRTFGYAPMDFSDAEEKHLGHFLNLYQPDFVSENRSNLDGFFRHTLYLFRKLIWKVDLEDGFNTVIFSNPQVEDLVKPVLHRLPYSWQAMSIHTLLVDDLDWVWFGYLAKPVEPEQGGLAGWDEVSYPTCRGSGLLRLVTPIRHIGNGVVYRGVGFHTPVSQSGVLLRIRQEEGGRS